MKRKYSTLTTMAAVAMLTGAFGATPVFAESAAPVAGVSGEQANVAAAQTVTVSGLKAGSTVKLYQIVDGYYKDGKLVKYVLMDPTNGKIAAIGDASKGKEASKNDIITEDEITTIANNIETGAFTADAGVDMTVGTATDTNGKVTATADVEPGLYMVLASDPAGEMVYNPAVVAVNITDVNANTASGGSVDMTNFFTTSGGTTASNVYVKSSESTASAVKKITGSTKTAVRANGDVTGRKLDPKVTAGGGDTVAIGDTQHFEISGIRIPSYSADYASPSYVITDKLDTSFTKVDHGTVKVTVGGTEVAASDTTYTVSDGTDSGFIITFNQDYLKSLRGKTDTERDVVVTYDAVLSAPSYNFAENHNRVTVTYANSPTDGTQTQKVDKDTYTYTFGIGATALDSESKTGAAGDPTSDSKTTTDIVIKAGADQVTTTTDGKGDTIVSLKEGEKGLAGATFTLYSDEDCKTVATGAIGVDASNKETTDGTTVSDANGAVTFKGLDEGTYFMKETVAPSNYGLADQTFKFVISATLDDSGVLKSYTVTTSYKDAAHTDWTTCNTATFAASEYKKASDGSIDYVKADDETKNTITTTQDGGPYILVDGKLQSMPSTGGMGLVLIVTLAAGAGVAGFVLDKKRKSAQAE